MLSDRQKSLCESSSVDYSDLKAVVVNCSLKREAAESHTAIVLSAVEEIFENNGMTVDGVHAAARDIAFGVQPDMTEHGASRDEWPETW